MDYYQGQELWNSGDKYNYPFLQMKYRELPEPSILILIQIIQIIERQFKKSILQTESLPLSEQISEQKRTWGIAKTCIIRYFRLNKFRNKFFVFCWSLKHYHNKPIIMRPLGAAIQRSYKQARQSTDSL